MLGAMQKSFVLVVLLLGCESTRSAAVDAGKPVTGKVQLLPAPAEPASIQELVKQKTAESKAKGRTLLVYAGASWCEPCRRFHDAAEKGALDAEFGDVDFLSFDVDFDNERLAYGNYETGMIPLIAVPKPDGNSSDKFMNGSVKGDGAVDQMTPRLKQLLGR